MATKILIEITEADGIFYATIIMTLMILIFGELIPKTLALSNADKFALKDCTHHQNNYFSILPLTKILNFAVGFILKLIGVDYKDSSREEILEKSEEELRGSYRSSWEGFNWERGKTDA